MIRTMRYLLVLLLLAACTTPMTVLKDPKTGQIAQCGGSANGSLAGGAIGYHIQKSNDEKCVHSYMEQGFEVVKTEN
ncbi:MAG: hypothetical protein KDD04_05815 [Sinomicrobium sp.]|nr:hypothetical protein [Sinomicrobium sp.]